MDITDWKQTQDTLIRERELLQKIIDAIPVMIVMYKPDTNILSVNPEFERVTGWTNEAAQGVSLMEEIYPDPTYREYVQAYMASLQPGWHDVQMRTRDHRIVQTSWANIRLKDDTQVGIGIDMSVRKQAEERAERKTVLLTHLQGLTGLLSQVLSREQIAQVIANRSFELVGARAGTIWELSPDGASLDLIAEHGAAQLVAQFGKHVPMSLNTPLTDAVNNKQEDWLTLDDFVERYPHLIQTMPQEIKTHMWGLLPLLGNRGSLGIIGYSFPEPRLLADEEKDFMRTVARQCAQALERTQLYEDERQARAEAEKAAERVSGLQSVTAALSRALTPAEVAGVILNEGLKAVGAASGQLVLLTDHDTMLETIHISGYPTEASPTWQRFPANTPSTPIAVCMQTKEPIWLHSLEERQAWYPIEPNMYGVTGYEARAAIPLIVNNRAIGAMALAFATVQPFHEEDRSLLMILAQQCAQALERARLYEAEQQARATAERKAARLSHLQWLTDQLDGVMTNEQIARIVADGSFELVGADIGLIWEMNKERSALEYLAHYGATEAVLGAAKHLPTTLKAPPIDVLKSREEMWLSFDEYAARYPDIVGGLKRFANTRSWGVLPLLGQEDVLGVMSFSFSQAGILNDEEKDFVRAIAQQCAQALERVRLYERVKADAAEEERKRLARDLHDAVNQTLYSATVIAESLPRLWERDPERTMPYLEQVLILNRAAMAEMRTLLWELRPEALEKTSLEDLCKQLANAIRGRKQVEVALDFRVDDPEPLPIPVHVAFYRIAQEALNNVVKHSQAKNVTITLISTVERVELRVSDDGHGFNTQDLSAGLGLGTMRERAEAVGAVFAMTSAVGSGTQVSVQWLRQRDPIPD